MAMPIKACIDDSAMPVRAPFQRIAEFAIQVSSGPSIGNWAINDDLLGYFSNDSIQSDQSPLIILGALA